MSKRPNIAGSQSSRSKEMAPFKHRRPLIELVHPTAIAERIVRVIDESRGRANLLLCQDKPVPVDIQYRYRETPHGIVLIHDDREAQQDERHGQVEDVDVKDIAALFVRDSLMVSHLRETPRNIRKMLDFVIGWTFSETRISGDDEVELTSAHIRSIEKTFNGPALKKIGVWRKVLGGIFTAIFLKKGYETPGEEGQAKSKDQPESNLALRRDRERGGLSVLDIKLLGLEALKQRQREKPDNKIYDAVCRPGLSIETAHSGKRRKTGVVDLIEAYIQVGREATEQRGMDIEKEFNKAQAETAVDAIIGKATMEKDAKKERVRAESAMAKSVAKAVDPILHAAIDRVLSR